MTFNTRRICSPDIVMPLYKGYPTFWKYFSIISRDQMVLMIVSKTDFISISYSYIFSQGSRLKIKLIKRMDFKWCLTWSFWLFSFNILEAFLKVFQDRKCLLISWIKLSSGWKAFKCICTPHIDIPKKGTQFFFNNF